MSELLSRSVYQELCEMFPKKDVDYAIAEARGKAPCTCRVKGAEKCAAPIHKMMRGDK